MLSPSVPGERCVGFSRANIYFPRVGQVGQLIENSMKQAISLVPTEWDSLGQVGQLGTGGTASGALVPRPRLHEGGAPGRPGFARAGDGRVVVPQLDAEDDDVVLGVNKSPTGLVRHLAGTPRLKGLTGLKPPTLPA